MGLPKGKYEVLAEQVREQREAARRSGEGFSHEHAQALTVIARELQGLIKRAQAVPGTYRVWTRLYDAQNEATELALQWEARKQ